MAKNAFSSHLEDRGKIQGAIDALNAMKKHIDNFANCLEAKGAKCGVAKLNRDLNAIGSSIREFDATSTKQLIESLEAGLRAYNQIAKEFE